MANLHDEPLKNIISANRDLVRRNIDEFLKLRDEIISEPQTRDLKIFRASQSEKIESSRLQQLRCWTSSDRIPIAFCGGISSGKTTFLHLFLGIGRILPSGDGPVTGRITKLTYAPSEQACIHVYKTIRDQTLDEAEVGLAPFFAGEKPDWLGVKQTLAKHVTRPEGMDETSEDFARWARCFVEIHLPSSILAQGFDVYDTPGNFAEVLHALVELIHPTLVFMYENPSFDEATTRSFVALKAALHGIDHPSIFFLNSKADLNRLRNWRINMNSEDFSSTLTDERARRYELLLLAPFLTPVPLESQPISTDPCRHFDICSAFSQIIKPFGPMMNETAVQRIIQFAVKEDSARANREIQLMLDEIDSFFDFSTTNHPRTPEELSALKTDAMNWTGRYFQAFTLYTDRFLTDLFANIFQRFDTDKRSIVELFRSHSWFSMITDQEVLEAVITTIVRPTVRRAVTECTTNLLKSIGSSQDLYPNIAHNEIFIDAISMQEMSSLTASLLEGEGTDTGLLYMVNTISIPIIACAAFLERHSLLNEAPSRRAETSLSVASRLRFLSNREAIIFPLMSRCREKLETQQLKLREAAQLSGQKQERMLRGLIEQQYNVASSRLLRHHEALQRLQHYSGRFTRIACELRAAQDMATFLAQTPKVHGDARQSSIFTTFTADWGHEKNLWVKKITQPHPTLPTPRHITIVVSLFYNIHTSSTYAISTDTHSTIRHRSCG